jgi:hypothetical protein
VLLQIDGVEYKFKKGLKGNTDMNKRFVGYIAQQIESVVPQAVSLIDGILHVDYESLIPYLSESIKQNFKDINDLNSKTDHIHQVVDMMYNEFIKNEQHRKNNKSDKGSNINTVFVEAKKSKGIWRFLITLVFASFIVIGVILGVVLAPIYFKQPPSTTPTPGPPQSSVTPLPETQTPTPILTPSPIVAPVPLPIEDDPRDRKALLDLYAATNGSQWNALGWGTNTSMCTWSGVTCNKSSARVEELKLSQFGLKGTIPNSLSALTQLTTLDLSSNLLKGTIPTSLATLKLQRLILSNNGLLGTVPAEIFSMTTLVDLYLDHNPFNFWGIPETVRQLTRLQNLNLDDSSLMNIPDTINLPSLVSVSMQNNHVVTQYIPNLTSPKLIDLRLSDSTFLGTIPALSSSIQVLHLARMRLGNDLQNLGRMKNLTDLDISGMIKMEIQSGP